MAEDALTFRILRLAKPDLGVDRPLKFKLDEDMVPDDRMDSHRNASTSFKEPFADRTELHSALDACGVQGLMVLSKSFGEAYLGEVSLRCLAAALQLLVECMTLRKSTELCWIHQLE